MDYEYSTIDKLRGICLQINRFKLMEHLKIR